MRSPCNVWRERKREGRLDEKLQDNISADGTREPFITAVSSGGGLQSLGTKPGITSGVNTYDIALRKTNVVFNP